MKIVEVIHCCMAGGAEVYIKNLMINMKNQNKENEYELWVLHEVQEFFKHNLPVLEFEKKYIKELEDNGIKVKQFNKCKQGIVGRIEWYKSIKKYYNESKPDIIHTHLETVTFNICMALFFKKVKIIETIHNEKINYGFLHQCFLNYKLTAIVSIANSVTESIKKNIRCKEKKIVQIYNGVNLEDFQCMRTFRKKETIKIIAIGRLIEQKNHKFLLKAFKRVTNKLKDEKEELPILEIYGQGKLQEELEQYIKENEIVNVKLKGITTQVNKVLAESDIYVMSSIFEGFSISLIEALVSGISIICTDVGGNREIIGENAGILVASNNEEQMVNALYELVKDSKKREELYNNCMMISNKFSIDECGKEHIKLYEFYR